MIKAKLAGALVVAMMAIGALAGSATAATGDTVLCTSASAPCPVASQYASGTSFTAALKSGTDSTLATNIDKVNCTTSTATVKNTAQSGTPLPGQLTALAFSSCKDSYGNNCTVTVNSLPYSGNILAGATAGDGTLTLTSANVNVTCGSVINCTFGAPSGGIAAAFTGGNPADVKFSGATLTHTAGLLCPSTATYTSDYQTNGTNKAVWVEKSS